jgi:hypothetical protein
MLVEEEGEPVVDVQMARYQFRIATQSLLPYKDISDVAKRMYEELHAIHVVLGK